MVIRHLLRINVGFVLLSIIIAGFWVFLAGGPGRLAELMRVQPVYVAPLLTITTFWAFVRFIRWQFLLRQGGVRVPTRESLSIFIASLAGTATPAYVGEGIRSVFLRRKFGVLMRITTSVLVVERLLDVAALGIIGTITADTWWMRQVMVVVVMAA